MQDHYAVLGLEPGATNKDIKTAYRQLAHALHPDANPDPAVAERFKQVTFAYDVLSNPQAREAYDRERTAGQGEQVKKPDASTPQHNYWREWLGQPSPTNNRAR